MNWPVPATITLSYSSCSQKKEMLKYFVLLVVTLLIPGIFYLMCTYIKNPWYNHFHWLHHWSTHHAVWYKVYHVNFFSAWLWEARESISIMWNDKMFTVILQLTLIKRCCCGIWWIPLQQKSKIIKCKNFPWITWILYMLIFWYLSSNYLREICSCGVEMCPSGIASK